MEQSHKTLKIGTLNTRGGGNKIAAITNTINKCGNNVICLQEMHSVSIHTKQHIEKSCNGTFYLSNGTTQSRGVATFVRNSPSIKKQREILHDLTGRKIVVEIQYENVIWTIFNLYAPNDSRQRHAFFLGVSEDTERARGRLIITGDFNCVLDRHLDRTKSESKGAIRADKSKETLNELLSSRNLTDTYRRKYPMGIQYTFTGPNGYRARLDRIYADTESANEIKQTSVQPISYSDHDLVNVRFGDDLDETDARWGRGRWILNSNLLIDQRTKEDVIECIKYCRHMKGNFSSILDWWDNMKIKIRETYISNGIRIKRAKSVEVDALELELRGLICSSGENHTERINNIKTRLSEIEKERIEANKIRSKEDWIDKRENCARYFYEEEKRRGELKTMSSLRDEKGNIVKSKREICECAVRFYRKLLTSEPLDEEILKKQIEMNINKQLTEAEKDSIEGIIRTEEILKSIKSMKNNKSPGLDELLVNFML